MGIRFFCQCGYRMNVKSFLAGKKGICPECGSKFVIPEKSDPRAVGGAVVEAPAPEEEKDSDDEPSTLVDSQVPTSTVKEEGLEESADRPDWSGEKLTVPAAPLPPAGSRPDAIAAAGNAVWYVRHSDGGQYGPAEPTIMRRWLEEGRIGADSLVWNQGWPDWKVASEVFPELATDGAASQVNPGTSPPPAGSSMPVAGEDPAQSFAPSDELSLETNDPGIALARKRELKRKRSMMMLGGLLVIAVSLCVVAAIVLLR